MTQKDQTQSKKDNEKLLLGFVLGATAGAGVALLLGPTVNNETKEKIAEKTAPLRNLVNSNLDNLLHYGVSALSAYAAKTGTGESSPLKTVIQVLSNLERKPEKKNKAGKKEGKKKHKNEPKDPE